MLLVDWKFGKNKIKKQRFGKNIFKIQRKKN